MGFELQSKARIHIKPTGGTFDFFLNGRNHKTHQWGKCEALACKVNFGPKGGFDRARQKKFFCPKTRKKDMAFPSMTSLTTHYTKL